MFADRRLSYLRSLLTFAAGLYVMQNVSLSDQKTLGDSVSLLSQQIAPDDVKCAILGLSLLNLLGEDVLRTAVNQLRPKLALTPAPPGTP